MSPVSRTVIALTLITLLGLLLFAVLVNAAIDRLRVRVVESNIEFILTELRESVESSVGLGLSLNEIQVAQDLVERSRIGNDAILAVEIFDPAGVSIYNTDRGSIGEPVTDDWIEAIRLRDDSRLWRLEEPASIVFGEEIRNDFGEAVGQVAIRLAAHPDDFGARDTFDTIVIRFAAIALPAMLAVALLSMLTFSVATRDLREVTRQLHTRTTPDATGDPTSLAATAAAMSGKIDETIRKVESAAVQVRALDEDEPAHEPV